MMPNTPTYTSHAALPGMETARSNPHFIVPIEEIKANDWDLSAHRCKEVEYEEVEYASVSSLISEIWDLDSQRSQLLNSLESLLGE